MHEFPDRMPIWLLATRSLDIKSIKAIDFDTERPRAISPTPAVISHYTVGVWRQQRSRFDGS